jgi:hypothetical protein
MVPVGTVNAIVALLIVMSPGEADRLVGGSGSVVRLTDEEAADVPPAFVAVKVME